MSRLLLVGLFACHAFGHGHISDIIVNGVSYQGWDINVFPYLGDNIPLVAAWGTPNTGGGYPTDGYSSPDMICHLDATNGEGSIPVTAGDTIHLQWTVWPDTHHGPVLDYLANCGTSCQTVDKTTLEFFKISEVGLIDDSSVPGYWATDELIDNNSAWLVKIPEILHRETMFFVMKLSRFTARILKTELKIICSALTCRSLGVDQLSQKVF